MIDTEKVVEGLKACTAWNGLHQCQPKYYGYDCPYDDESDCKHALLTDALALLKEQDAVKPKSEVGHGAYAQIQHFCGNCNTMLRGKPKHCPECGRMVLWKVE